MSSKTGVPLGVLPARGPTAKQAERMTRINDSDLPRVSTQSRNKQESREDRKVRKQAIKEERKVSVGAKTSARVCDVTDGEQVTSNRRLPSHVGDICLS